MEEIRLNKYLSEQGVCSRREADRLIEAGKVTIDGRKAEMGEKVTGQETIICDGKPVGKAAGGKKVKPVLLVVNKPRGIVCTTSDKDRAPNVVDLIKYPARVYPVGRLDKDTEGLLLITNDGALAHQLLAPKKHVDKVYYAKVHGWVTEDTVSQFAKGLNIGTDEAEEWTRPAKLVIVQAGDDSEIRLTIQEGKFHQVKRMFQAVGMEVT